MCSLLHSLISKIWQKNCIPDAWRVAKLVAVPKKSPNEYRGISLLSSAYKIYSKI
jgi:hypothetical protein